MKLTSKLKIALKSLLSVELAETETDKAVLVYDGELAEGIEVFVKDEEAEDGVKPAEDGTYETETQIIEVADGKITKITDKEEKEDEQPVEKIEIEAKQVFEKKKAVFEDTYSDKIRKIQETISSKGFDCYIIDASDSYAIAEVWNEDNATWTDYRFEISWDEDGNAVADDGVEVKHEYVTVDEKEHLEEVREGKIELEEQSIDNPEDEPADEPEEQEEPLSIEDRLSALETLSNDIKSALEQILNGISGIEGRVDSLEEKVAQIDETPADEPADSDNEAEEGEHTKAYYLRKQ